MPKRIRDKEKVKVYSRRYYLKHLERDGEIRRVRRAEYRRDNLEKVRQSNKEYMHRYVLRLKVETLSRYGGVCQCCGEADIRFLGLDHINGGGSLDRKQRRANGGNVFYMQLRREGFPSGFQVLCYNCNWAKGTKECCPHQLPDYKPITCKPPLEMVS